MEKMKAFLTQKVNKNTFKDDNVKRAIKLTLCGALIVALMIQAIGCFFAPMSAYAAENSSIVGTWVFNDVITVIDGVYSIDFTCDFPVVGQQMFKIGISPSTISSSQQLQYYRYNALGNEQALTAYQYKTNNVVKNEWTSGCQVINIYGGTDITNETFITWLKANAVKQVTDVYDFTGETRLFNAQLTRPPMVQADVEQYVYQFDYKVYGGYTADYMIIGRSLDEWDLAFSFIDDGSGGITTMYRQQFNQTEGRWLRSRNRLIEFISNPEDPDLQQWLLDNTVLVDNTSVGIGYDYGYDIGYNDGWTNSAIGDTLKAPVDALNSIVLLQTSHVTITLGGVIFTMVVLSIMLIFLKKYAGG